MASAAIISSTSPEGCTPSTSTQLKGKSKLQPPSSSTFSFKAPLLSASSSATSTTTSSTTSGATTPVKLRRVSMALVSSPKVVPESTWSFRDDTGIEMHAASPETCLMPEKKGKLRKIAVDADDDVLTEKKQRKRWSPEETQMLVDGCNKHGVGNWKTILGDPEFMFDNRSPVDLKDRFRTYFPDAYKQHYPNARTHLSSKIRSTLPDGTSLFEKTRSKKRRPFTEEEDRALKAGYEKHGTVWATIVKDPIFQEQNRRSTDLRDRFRNAYPDLYQAAGYKPRTAAKKKMISPPGEPSSSTQAKMLIRAATDDQLSMSTSSTRRRKRRNTSQGFFRGGTKSVPQSASPSEDEDSDHEFMKPTRATRSNSSPLNSLASTSKMVSTPESSSSPVKGLLDDDMGLITMDTDPLADALPLADFPDTSHSEIDAQSQTWSSGLDTPVHSHHTWTGSPTSSHLSSDYLLSSQSSPFQGRNEGIVGGMGMIGKSAWGTQDWFSANPRLDSSGSTTSSSLLDGGFSPASPFSFNHLNHGIFDRYDLMPAANPHDFSSEVGVGESRSTFSDEMFPPSSGFRGFTHHSDYAGDLIFGARTHQPQASSYYGSGFGNLGGEGQTMGLGLSGMDPSTGINPMQLHTPALPGIDEIELTGITLDDNGPSVDTTQGVDDSGIDMNVLHVRSPTKDDTLRKSQIPHHFHLPPPRPQSVMSETRLIFEDIVDMSGEAHTTPPGTPLSPSRQNRKRSLNCNSHFSRSISVPPGERNQISSPPMRPIQMHSTSQSDVMTDGARGMFRSEAQVPLSSDDSRMSISSPHSHRSPSPPMLSSPGPLQNPPSFSSLFLASVSHLTGHHSQQVNGEHRDSGDNNNLPFLDLHYGGTSMSPPPAMDESQNYRQALDLAQSIASASSVPKHGFFTGPLAGQGPPPPEQARATVTDPRQTRAFRGRSVDPNPDFSNVMSTPTMPLSGRMIHHSSSFSHGQAHGHHRGQSAVCPQDLMLRSDNNKRKRASWDGAHLLNSAC
ncbi:hypothetical protein L218DRAFT_1002152 [Marasmius fiardii PR-910]|nr:hypothetical protein L218DRAFT_1002152 [Marasmius fiardii PR-910]